MGFISKTSSNDPIVTVEENGDGGVVVNVGETAIFEITEQGEVLLCDYVDKDEVGDLKLTEGKDDGWGSVDRRVRIFFNGEELTPPSEQKAVKAKTKRTKKASF